LSLFFGWLFCSRCFRLCFLLSFRFWLSLLRFVFSDNFRHRLRFRLSNHFFNLIALVGLFFYGRFLLRWISSGRSSIIFDLFFYFISLWLRLGLVLLIEFLFNLLLSSRSVQSKSLL
jgi:hypothetical protein